MPLKSFDSIGICKIYNINIPIHSAIDTVRPHKLLSFNPSQDSPSLFDLGLYPASTLIVKAVSKTAS